MAISRNNALTKGLSGMIGGTVVFRQCNGKTIIANRPRKARRVTEKQVLHREKFKEAAYFAKAMMQVPEMKAYYVKRAKKMKVSSAYVAALTEQLRGGEVRRRKNEGRSWSGVFKSLGVEVRKCFGWVAQMLESGIERVILAECWPHPSSFIK